MLLNFGDTRCYIIFPEDDCEAVIDEMLAEDYNEEFCFVFEFEPAFVARLMKAGFLVMSANVKDKGTDPVFILLPKLHTWRSALFFENLHVKKSIRRFLNRYELRPDAEFDYILDRCIQKHGDDWLTPPLVDCIKRIRRGEGVSRPPASETQTAAANSLLPCPYPYPATFGLYRNNSLVAGDFGVVCNNVYTSYSGYYDEPNAGTVQIILTTRYLQQNGFSFFDLGMPMDYKTELGAEDIGMHRFVKLFRNLDQAGNNV